MPTEGKAPPGHVKISRKAFLPLAEGGDLFWNQPRKFSMWEAWQDLIQLAAYRAHPWALRGNRVIEIARGETHPLAVRFLARRWRWGKNAVLAYLDLLKKRDKIRDGQRTADGDTYVIVKYDTYQSTRDRDRDATGDTGGNADGTQTGTKQKQGKKGKHYPPLPPQGTDEFEAFWSGYPKRSGSNPKATARKAWNQRLREGVPPTELLAARDRYAAFVEATGRVGTEYVLQAATFLGPSRRWEESWEPPSKNGRHGKDEAQELIDKLNAELR